MSTKPYTDCMVDFETLGLRADCHTLQVGWAFFNREGSEEDMVSSGHIFDRLEQKETQRSQTQSTLRWWKTQDKALLKRISTGGVSVKEILQEFDQSWDLFADSDTWIWSNGPAFDQAILDCMYDDFLDRREDTPYEFWNVRDMRTALSMFPFTKRARPDVAHDGESDAIAQAKTIIRVWDQL